MARSRLELHKKLEDLIGSKDVYFQPPEGFKMRYPCILYNLTYVGKLLADNEMYRDRTRYDVTIIDEDPDSDYQKEIIKWPYCSFNRFYTADNLNHWVFELYF